MSNERRDERMQRKWLELHNGVSIDAMPEPTHVFIEGYNDAWRIQQLTIDTCRAANGKIKADYNE